MTKLFEQPDVFNKRVTKPFERLTQTACKQKAIWKRKVISVCFPI